MNKFAVVSCADMKDDEDMDYDGYAVILAYIADPTFLLFFPIPEESAKVLEYVLQENTNYDVNTSVLGLYKTMIDSWRTTDRYLSGMIMDAAYDEGFDDDILMVKLALADSDGALDSLVNINFVNAMIVAAMNEVQIIISEKLLSKLNPPDDIGEGNIDIDIDKEQLNSFPEDKKILKIVKEIMNGKIKEDDIEKK